MSIRTKFRERKLWQKCLILILCLILLLAFSFAAFICYLTLTEFNPDKEISLKISGDANLKKLDKSKELSIVTWNIGYGGLASDADFFMDGGKMVQTTTEKALKSNLDAIASNLNSFDADIVLLQEIDKNSKRSFGFDETKFIHDKLLTSKYQANFAENFKVKYVPYPIPPIGRVDSGIMTLCKNQISEATRYSLPVPFKWPQRVANLKRCLSISRLPIDATSKELVIINLHLEAYDDGEGKKAQTEILNEYLQSELKKGNYVIAGGDFNQTFSGIDASGLKRFEGAWQASLLHQNEFGPSWQFMMDNKTASCRSLDRPLDSLDPNKFQFYIIDGFIVSNNIEVTYMQTQSLGFEHSDHNPVMMKFKLK